MNRDCCQSCGMLFDEARPERIGKEKNGQDAPYCIFCYQDGVFTQPDITLFAMVDQCSAQVMSQDNLNEEEARAQLFKVLPRLARWAK